MSTLSPFCNVTIPSTIVKVGLVFKNRSTLVKVCAFKGNMMHHTYWSGHEQYASHGRMALERLVLWFATGEFTLK